MGTRNITDFNGNIIGSLELPDDTDDSVWIEKLGHYTYVIPAKTAQEIVDAKVAASIRFGLLVIKTAATDNVLSGITAAGKTREVSDYLSNVERYLRSGSLYAAIDELSDMLSHDVPEGIETWVSHEKIGFVKSSIEKYLGII